MYNHLEDAMQAKCENDDPAWTALLASFLQTSGCLRLGHIIRRSVPVERYDGWVLFFCKRGKQKHNRQGFYWGAPSRTSSGWDWATPFLELYKTKRESTKGEALMGAIFRTDDFEHFTPRAVNIITQAAMQEVVDNPQLLGTYSWRRYLPTIALAIGCSKEERLALGDWQDKELIKEVAPITLRYAEGKAGLSRQIKVKLARVQTFLRERGTAKFDDITEVEWKSMWLNSQGLEQGAVATTLLWRNPDVLEQTREFAIREPRINYTMPKMITEKEIYLRPTSRDGQHYCPLFQQGICNMDDETGGKTYDDRGRLMGCRLGKHLCAAVFRGDRACHGNHPGKDCINTKRHWKPHDGTQGIADQHEAKRAKVQQQGEGSANKSRHSQREETVQPPAKRAKSEAASSQDQQQPGQVAVVQPSSRAVMDASIMDERMSELIKKRQRRQGIRTNPETPTLVAKVCERGGELWLGPVPTIDRVAHIESKAEFSIQIGCFKKWPTEVMVDECDENSRGVVIENAEYFKLEMSNETTRQQDFRRLRTTLLTSLRQGDNAYIHCMTGLCRAPLAASICASLLMNEDVDHSMQRIENVRNVQMEKAKGQMGGRHGGCAWMHTLVDEPCIVHADSDFYLAGTTRPTSNVVHAAVTAVSTINADYPLCKWKRGGAGAPSKMHNARISKPEEAKNFSSNFCQDCLAKLPASRRMHVKRVFEC